MSFPIIIPRIFESGKESKIVKKIEFDFLKKCTDENLYNTVQSSIKIPSFPRPKILDGILVINNAETFCYAGDRIIIYENNWISVQDRNPKTNTSSFISDDSVAIDRTGRPITDEYGNLIKNNSWAIYKFGKISNPGKPWARYSKMEPDMALYVFRTALSNIENKLYKLLNKCVDNKDIPESLTDTQKKKLGTSALKEMLVLDSAS